MLKIVSLTLMVTSVVIVFMASSAAVSSAGIYDGITSGIEVKEMIEWAEQSFLPATDTLKPKVDVVVRKQDHGVLCFGKSCLKTPIKIGEQEFEHGLGTHAYSEIAVAVPDGAARFEASVGIDNNHDTQGKNGSVNFVVEMSGKEVYRSQVLRGGDKAVPVSVPIPSGVEEIILKVYSTDDGAGYDQSDWADARFIMKDGSVLWLDENQDDSLISTRLPFSFIYDGIHSSKLLRGWKCESISNENTDYIKQVINWTDPKTGLRVTAEVKAFKEYPVVDWVLYFENTGKSNTPIIEDIQALDTSLRTEDEGRPVILHQIQGDSCGSSTFQPFDTEIEPNRSINIAPYGGRSSNGAFPFFNLEYSGEGIITAIGWTGQWKASFDRPYSGATCVKAGMEKTHLVLYPGERIRSPRILVMSWKGDCQAAHNLFRRLMLSQYVPKQNGQPVQLPFALQCFDRYSRSRPDWGTEAGQIEAAKAACDLGCDTLWLDAAWFPGGFPNGVGNLTCKPEEFPNGLKPVSDACHKLGLKFMLWFEPERVCEGTDVSVQHPEFVYGHENRQSHEGLFKLGEPAALQWMTDLLSKRITEYGVDIYRQDFNMDPLEDWRANDEPDRVGMTEILYIQGLYKMWDDLLARHPGLIIDNCASGGRRIDLEMCMRSIPMWRSDTNCWAGNADLNQLQSLGLGQYVPLSMACGWQVDPYDFRSSTTAGSISQWDYMNAKFPAETGKKLVEEAKKNAPYWYGDFYPLMPSNASPDQFSAYQLHRPDMDAGLVLAFRRQECDLVGIIVSLKGINPEMNYIVEFVDESLMPKERKMTGRELISGVELRPGEKHSSLVVRYRADSSGR